MNDPTAPLPSVRFEPSRPDHEPTPWAPLLVPRAEIEREIERLVASPVEGSGVRRTLLVHPRGTDRGRGLAPGIQVSVEVAVPGDDTRMPQRTASSLCFALRGHAEVGVNEACHAVEPRGVWTVPPMAAERYESHGPFAFLRFSNAALLEQLGVSWEGPHPCGAPAWPQPDGPPGTVANADRVGSFAPTGPFRLEYERLIDPPWVGARSWHWRWADVKAQLDSLGHLDERYHGRRVCLLYDPATGRTNGTTFTLLASMAMRPAGIVDRPHRHAAAAVNYFFEGAGWSVVGGRRIEWSAGDLAFVAPGWTTHGHAAGDAPVYQMAVQDNPLHLAMGSLLWQEHVDDAPRLLGLAPGYTTNRHEFR